MKLFVYDINDHLSSFHCQRLRDAVDRAGCSLGDYIEATLKREIFQPPVTKRARTKRPLCSSDAVTVTATVRTPLLAAAIEALRLESAPKHPKSSRIQPVDKNSGNHNIQEAAATP